MDTYILCTLLAQRIPPEQFQMHDLKIRWVDEIYNTTENQAIIDYVIANYNTLAEEYEQEVINEQIRVEEHEIEKTDFVKKTIVEKENWAKDRMNETTLDTETKIAIGTIIKRLIAYTE